MSVDLYMETNGYDFEISRHIRKAARMTWTHIANAWDSRADEDKIMLEIYLAIVRQRKPRGIWRITLLWKSWISRSPAY